MPTFGGFVKSIFIILSTNQVSYPQLFRVYPHVYQHFLEITKPMKTKNLF